MSPLTQVLLPVALNSPLWKRGLENTDVRRTIIENESEAAKRSLSTSLLSSLAAAVWRITKSNK